MRSLFRKDKIQRKKIELSIANTSTVNINQVKAEALDIPEGIKFREKSVTLTDIRSKEEQSALFTFTIDKKVRLNTEHMIGFTKLLIYYKN
ncbi:MAG: hypothetical protein JXA06_03815 [Bacteroidetes bacterium]|nr:hypothetical protein [Bacteroidota bacterium]